MFPLTHIFYIIIIIFLVIEKMKCIVSDYKNVHEMEAGSVLNFGAKSRDRPDIFCYSGRPKSLVNIWETVFLQLDLSPDQFEQYDGASPRHVMLEFEERRSSWSINLFSWKSKDIQLSPFNRSCVGIHTSAEYKIQLSVIRVDYWRVLLAGGGVLLFLSATQLSQNALFYYLSGISFGICASFLILVYLLSKLLPKECKRRSSTIQASPMFGHIWLRVLGSSAVTTIIFWRAPLSERPVMYGFVVGGWTVGVYMLQLLWDNLRTVVLLYQKHVLGYALVTGLVSFVVCYRLGPVSDPRSRNLIKWTLQVVALLLIYCSSHYDEATVAIDILLLTGYNIPSSWTSKLSTFYKKNLFRPKPQLLTEAEYNEQGVIETEKGLEALRVYCSSPTCNQWQTVLKLKEPLRFAQFMEGASHLNDNEMLAFETLEKRIMSEDVLTDDSEG